MVQKQGGGKNAKKVPELWIWERGKMFEEYFFALGGVCQKMRAEKLRKVAGKNIYKLYVMYLNIYVERNRDGREHALNG